MLSVLNEFSKSYRFRLVVQDIDQDPQLLARFNALVPVLYLGDREICHYFLDLVALEAALDTTS